MELIEDSEKRKVYKEEGTTYTMLDMGSYIGHRNRPWYQKPAPVWYLMSMDETTEKGTTHVESLVDDMGNYIRFIIENGPIRRVILLQGGMVFSDSVVIVDQDDDGFGPNYSALDEDPYSEKRYPLESYILNPLPYDLKGEELPGEIPSLDILARYLEANNNLYNEIVNGEEAKL